MLHTSLAVIHQTPRFTVTQFCCVDKGGKVIVIERLNGAGETTNLRTLIGAEATKFKHGYREAVDISLNTRPIAKPFATDDFIQSNYF